VYSRGYSYLLHRLQVTGAAATFSTSLRVDCTPMRGFDFPYAKSPLEGRDRYDFFVAGFCPPNCVLLDRSRIEPADLRANESLSKNEDYRIFASIAAKYETDWASVGTPVAEYWQRSDGSNSVLTHRADSASRLEWNEVTEGSRLYLSKLTTKVPIADLVKMRIDEQRLRRELSSTQQYIDQVYASTSWRLTAPVRAIGRLVRRLSKFG
jgi:hypothetical protein